MYNKVVSIHQPSYFSWLGLLDKINQSDCYVFMDDVQLSDSAYQNRNIFLTNTGNIKYLNINLSKKGYKEKALKDLELSNPNWQKEHLNFFDSNYKKHPFYKEVLSEIIAFYEKPYNNLGETLFENMKLTLKLFGVKANVIRQSDLAYNKNVKKGELVIELIKAVGYNTYLSGKGATAYISDEEFERANLKVIYQGFTHPKYKQINSPNEFVPGLSCLDFLFNCGLEEAQTILNKARE